MSGMLEETPQRTLLLQPEKRQEQQQEQGLSELLLQLELQLLHCERAGRSTLLSERRELRLRLQQGLQQGLQQQQ